jgi:hypothetical protein
MQANEIFSRNKLISTSKANLWKEQFYKTGKPPKYLEFPSG